MTHLPNGWTMATVGTLTEPVPKRAPTGSDGESFTYVDLSSVDQQLKQIVTPTDVPVVEAPSRARQVVATGDVLVSTVRPNLNGVATVPAELDGATASTGFCVLRPNPRTLDGRYLFHWVRSPRFISSMVRLSTGASYPAVSDRIVKSSAMPLPPLEEQRRIAAILDKADELRAKRRAALHQLDTLTQAIFLDMFGDRLRDQSRDHWFELNDLVDPSRPICYGILKPGPDIQEGVPYVRVVDMRERSVDQNSVRRTTAEIEEKYRRSRLKPGDLLLSIRGHVGRLALVPDQLEGANITQDSARVGIEHAEPLFVMEYLSTPFAQRWMQRNTKGVAVRGINIGDVRRIPVPRAPLADQRRFVSVARRGLGTSTTTREAVTCGDELFQSLQSRAFRGEL